MLPMMPRTDADGGVSSLVGGITALCNEEEEKRGEVKEDVINLKLSIKDIVVVSLVKIDI